MQYKHCKAATRYRGALGAALLLLGSTLSGHAPASVPAPRPASDPSESAISQQRELFVEAGRALEQGQDQRFDELLGQLHDYPLFPYLVYDRALRHVQRLDQQGADAVLAVLEDTPLPPAFRAAWARELYRRGQLDSYLALAPEGGSSTGQCRYLDALFRTGRTEEALDGVTPLWLVGHSQPATCDAVFDKWRSAGRLSTELVWERIRLAMERGEVNLARYLGRFLDPDEQRMAALWRQLYSHPELAAEAERFEPRQSLSTGIRSYGFRRWARRDVQAALLAWQRAREHGGFDAMQIAAIETDIAWQLLREGAVNALDWLQQNERSLDDDRIQTALVFEAVRQQRWQDALAVLERRIAAEPDELRWQYWKARCLEALGRGEAQALYAAIAGDRGYYGFLAADRAGLPYHIEHHPLPVDQAVVEQMRDQPAVVRARELLAVGRPYDARREWRELAEHLDSGQIMAISVIADTWGWHDQAILTVAKLRMYDDMQLRFPLAHLSAVQRNSEQLQIDPAWILAVVRQESIFSPDVRSSKGATGLMQLMPGTARKVSRDTGTPLAHIRDLTDPNTNLALGSRYLKQMLERFSGNRVLAISAYNAGPARTQQWLDFAGSLPADLWIERVPFKETRNYLQRVLTYTAIYQYRLGQEPQRLGQVMQPVAGDGEHQASPPPGRTSS